MDIFESRSTLIAQLYWLLTTIGHVSLFPLLFRPTETPVTALFVVIFAIVSFLALCRVVTGA